MSDFQNLYEVVKTVRFELKPSKATLSRTNFDNQFEIKNQLDQKIEMKKLFNNDNLEAKNTTKEFIEDLVESIENKVYAKYNLIIKNISNGNRYKNYAIYLSMDKIRNLGKGFRDCYQAMKKTGKRGWKYPGLDFNTGETKLLPTKFVAEGSKTWTQLCGFNYNNKNKIGEFEYLFWKYCEKINKSFNTIKLELEDFLSQKNETEKFITKPEILDRIKRLCWLVKDIQTTISIFLDHCDNGSEGCTTFICDIKQFGANFD